MILDEARSNVDSHTDEVIQRVIRQEFSGRPILTVAHRMNTILDSDVIVVMDEGCIAESGTPQDLLYRGGAFAVLVGNKGGPAAGQAQQY